MKNWIKGLIAGVIIVLIIVGCIYSIKYVKALNGTNTNLISENGKLNSKLTLFRHQREIAWSEVDSLGKISYYLETKVAEKDLEIKALKDSLKRIPEVIETIPPEESYDWLNVRYPDELEKQYELSGLQITKIHVELASYDLLLGINEKLTESNSILKNQIITKNKVEDGLLEVIKLSEAENKYLKETINGLQEDNVKVKVQRNVAGATALTVITILGIVILL